MTASKANIAVRVPILCGLVALLDGFDTQVIAYVAPRIADEWGIAPPALAPALAAGPLGLAAGAFLLTPLADRFGRRPLIIVSTALFGLFALLTAWAETVNHLVIVRFLTGIGLGAAMPNIIALTAEVVPERRRGMIVTLMFGGLPLGSTIGGFVATGLMSAYGWPAVFVVGGVLPLLLVPVLWWGLTESPMLGQRAADSAPKPRLPVAELFRDGRTGATLLLWTVYFASLLAIYFLVNWLPTLLRQAGLPLNIAIISTATLNFGGAVGGVVLGLLIDRGRPHRVLAWSFGLAILAIAGLAMAGTNLTLLMVLAALGGFTLVGAQTGTHVLTGMSYPAEARATGIGWSLGVGRIGAIIGPLIGGALLAAQWAPDRIILMGAVPLVVAFLAVSLLGRLRPLK